MTFKKGYLLSEEDKEKRLQGQRDGYARRVLHREQTGLDSKWHPENRPYFMELPEGWETHKHLNVVPYDEFINGQSYTPQEFSVAVIGAKLEKIGYFAITPQKLKQPVIRHPFLSPIVQPKVKREEEPTEEALQALEEDDE